MIITLNMANVCHSDYPSLLKEMTEHLGQVTLRSQDTKEAKLPEMHHRLSSWLATKRRLLWAQDQMLLRVIVRRQPYTTKNKRPILCRSITLGETVPHLPLFLFFPLLHLIYYQHLPGFLFLYTQKSRDNMNIETSRAPTGLQHYHQPSQRISFK